MNEIFDTFLGTPESRPLIPQTAYRPVKRCPNCQSVYLTDVHCEACGRSLLFHPIGEPFGAKSLYGFKERYCESFPIFVRYFPFFENKTGKEAKTYLRQLTKRFDELLEAFGTTHVIEDKNRRYFYVEMMALIDELLCYGQSAPYIQLKLEAALLQIGPLLTQELLLYLQDSKKDNHLTKSWTLQLSELKVYGINLDYMLKAVVITATAVALAVNYYGFIGSQFGK